MRSDQDRSTGSRIIGRVAVPDERLREIVATGPKQIIAFNLCDGSLGLSEVAKKAGLNKGNLSRAAKRWVQEGAAFWIGEGQNARLLHLYPLAKQVGSRKLNSTVRDHARASTAVVPARGRASG